MRSIKSIGFLAIIIFTVIVLNNVSKAGNTKPGFEGYNLKDTTVKAVWREDVYDQKMKSHVSVIVVNEEYFSNLSEPEKAVLGYLASTIGNECYSDGTGIKCRLLTALNMGGQCSETNKQFLSAWFKNEPAILAQVENCKPTLPGANVEKTFDVVKVSTAGDVIKVSVKGLKLNIKESSSSTWSENITFKVSDNSLTLVERKKAD